MRCVRPSTEWEKAIADRLREEHAGEKQKIIDFAGLATLVVAIFSGAMSLAKAAQSTTPSPDMQA